MRRRRVFIDSSFVSVLLDRSDDRYVDARVTFERLLTEFELGTTMLYSHGSAKDMCDGRTADLLAVCDVAPSRRWLTRAAERAERDHPELLDTRYSAELVLMSHLRIDEVASFDPFFEQHGIPTVGS